MSRYGNQSTISIPGRTQVIRAGRLASIVGALLILLALSPRASAQVTGGTISGSVTDPSGGGHSRCDGVDTEPRKGRNAHGDL